MIAKIYIKIGSFYVKIDEMEIKDLNEVFKEWKDVYIEVFDENENLIFAGEI